jgi:hypothetical protein
VESLAAYTGIDPEEARVMFGDEGNDPVAVTQAIIAVINAKPSDFATLTPLQQELYLRVGLTSFTDGSSAFATTDGSPFDVIDLIADVEDDETRDMMLRRMFYAAEQQEEGAQGTLRFLQWAEQLPPELTASLREGATIQVDLPLTGPQDLLNELIDGGPGYGGADVSFTLDRMTPEQRTVYLDALPSLIDSQAFLTRYAEVHGEPFPYADAGPVAWMFLGMPDASSQAGMIAALQGTPYAEQLTSFAQAHPEQFLGAEVPIDYRQAAVTQLVNAGLDPTTFGVSATDTLALLDWDVDARARFFASQAGSPGWPALQEAVLNDPSLLFRETGVRDTGDVLAITDALEAAGVPRELVINMMARAVTFDDSDYSDARRLMAEGGPEAVAARLVDIADDGENMFSGYKRDWVTGLMLGVAGDPAASQTVVSQYAASSGQPPTNLLVLVQDDPTQLGLMMEVLESAGYSAEVAQWRLERGY